MDEARLQAYVNLIEQLLTCANDEERTNTLQANQELIDPEFLQEMENYAVGLEEQGNNNPAAWLRNIAQQLGQYLNPQANPTQPSNQLSQAVYVLLYNAGTDNEGIHTISHQERHTILLFESLADATNFAQKLREQKLAVPSVETMETEKIISFCQEARYNWEIVPEGANRTPPHESVKTLGIGDNLTIATANTSQDYFNFLMEVLRKVWDDPNPNLIDPFLAQNLDKLDEGLAIVFHDWARQALIKATTEQSYYITRDAFNLSNLIREFRPSNITLEQENAIKQIAIEGYEIALLYLTFDAFPIEWARTKQTIAHIYLNEIKGKKTDKVEKAISCYEETLQVFTQEQFAEDWARTMIGLGLAYTNRIKGNRSENIELAFVYCIEALKVYSFEAFPQEWAMTQNNLGNVYNNRIIGDKTENLERGITAFTKALKVHVFETFPYEWATIHNNLANIYLDRIRGNKADNLETAIISFTESLKIWTFDAFPYERAGTLSNLASAYNSRIKGDKAENLEQAIFYYQEALQVRTFEIFSQDWADIQNNLAIAYLYRIRGDKAENLEIAISAYKEALKVRNFDNSPYEWAVTQNNLGNAYFNRIRGDKADNLEMAILAYTEALKVRTFEVFPYEWAMTKHNLSGAYSDRIRGEKAENLEKAIFFSKEALKVHTFEDFSENWASTQNTLANVYVKRIKGDKAENLEKAITAYTEALKVKTFDAFPQDWASIKNNLANVYTDRTRGEMAENLEMAITCLQEAMTVKTFNTFPEDWAKIKNSLANAYSERIRGDKAENLEMAIATYTEALKVRTFDTFPQQWAMTKNNLANAYYKRIRGDKAENLEMAISAHTEALKVSTFDAFPQDWASTQNNLANAYYKRIRGDKAENLKKAIKSYQNALQIWTKENDPLKCLLTARNLAILHYDEKQWQPATETYHIAVGAVENARLEALNPQSRQEVLSNAIDVFHRIIQAHLNLSQPEKALEYIERSKARNLVELITQKNFKPQGISQTVIDEYDRLRQQVVNEQIRLQNQSINQNLSRTDNLMAYVQDHSYIQKYQQQLDTFIEQEITPTDPTFKLNQKVKLITFEEIQSLTDTETCLLQWYITNERILAFIVSSDGNINLWQSTETDLQKLIEIVISYLNLYYSDNGKQEWINQLSNLLQTFSETLHLNEIINLIPSTCQRLIIIPHRFLHILPFHAFPISEDKILQDKYTVQYAPSCQILQRIQHHHQHEPTNILAIQNPTKDLSFTDLEVNIIATLFTQNQIIAKDNATQNTVTTQLKNPNYHCHHFSCHGSFNPNNPLESALILAEKEPLTLSEIFELNLKKSRLVVLSACETGMIDLQSLSDEYIGLPSGFLFAGSQNVVSSLWTVNDLSTAFLMIKFYQILLDPTQQVSVAIALKTAQNWLRTLNREKFIFESNQIIDKLDGKKPRMAESYRKIAQQLLLQNTEEYPFQNPYYWAAFIASGQ
jgi:CHAT domain-containing protein